MANVFNDLRDRVGKEREVRARVCDFLETPRRGLFDAFSFAMTSTH